MLQHHHQHNGLTDAQPLGFTRRIRISNGFRFACCIRLSVGQPYGFTYCVSLSVGKPYGFSYGFRFPDRYGFAHGIRLSVARRQPLSFGPRCCSQRYRFALGFSFGQRHRQYVTHLQPWIFALTDRHQRRHQLQQPGEEPSLL